MRRVIDNQQPVAHVAKELGISRQCAHRWVNRYRDLGEAGLHDRTSRPHTSPTRTDPATEQRVIAARHRRPPGTARRSRRDQRRHQRETGVPARTVTRILTRHGIPPLVALDPLTGEQIRATHRSGNHYEHDEPGPLVHVTMNRTSRSSARSPTGAVGAPTDAAKKSADRVGRGIGYDFIHACVDDHSRFAYAEILPDERGDTCAAFFTRAAAAFAAAGITRIQRVMTDRCGGNAFAYRKSLAFRAAVAAVGARQKFTRPHCPWTNGKVERFNRTLGTEWAYRQVFTSNTARADALRPWLMRYNTTRPHHALGRRAPITRLPVTNVSAEYT